MSIALSKNALKLSILLLLCSPVLVVAQKANVETASIVIKKIKRAGETEKMRKSYILEAKEYIDKAYKNESTANYSKMWLVRGRVYFEIHADTLFVDENGKKASLDVDAIEKSVTSLINCKKVDTKKKYKNDNERYLLMSTSYAFQEAYNAFIGEDYDRALKYFNLVLTAIPHNDEFKLSNRNITKDKVHFLISRVAAEKKDNKLALEQLNILIENAYNDPNIYVFAAKLMLAEKDTVGALNYFTQGKALFSDNIMLITEEISMYVNLGRSDELIKTLGEAIQANEYEPMFIFFRGSLHDKQATAHLNNNEVDNSNASLDLAEKDYLKTLELDPEYFNALFNLGGLYQGKGKSFMQEADSYGFSASDQAKSKEALEKAKGFFLKAIERLELAHEVDPKDKDVIESLMSMYLYTEQNEKWKAMKEKR